MNFNYEYNKNENIALITIDKIITEDDSINVVCELMEYNIDVDFSHNSTSENKTVYIWSNPSMKEDDKFTIEHTFKDYIV